MNLEKELNYAYKMIADRFDVNFTKPKILAGDEHKSKFIRITCLRDFARPLPEMLYDDATNIIFVPTKSRRKDKYRRIWEFSHELGHSLICQSNPNTLRKEITKLIEGNEAEKGGTLIAFHEGMSSYIAIESCKRNKHPDIIEKANENKENITNFLEDWLDLNLPFLSKFYNTDNWKNIIINYLRDNKGVIQIHRLKYPLGYLFASTLDPKNIIDVIKHPPENFEELLYPDIYISRQKIRKA